MVWATLLFLLALAFLVLEVFVPSGGVLGTLTAACAFGSIVLAFREGPTTGLVFLTLTVVLLPAALALAFQVWPHTPLGRRFLLPTPTDRDTRPDTAQLQWLRSLVGATGRAISPMLPSGAVELQGRSVDALSEGLPIEAGCWVRVVEVRGARVVVRPVDGPDPLGAGATDLSQPIDRLAPDPFQEPSA